jgi:ssDNA-binding protein
MASLMTPENGVLNWPRLFQPALPKNAKPTDKPAYSTTILFTKEDTETAEYKALVAAVVACAKEKWGDRAEAMIREGSLRLPFRKDVASKGYPADFVSFINVRAVADPSKPPPQVISRSKKPITDPKEIYSGARARVTLGVYAYDVNGNKGVSFGLRNVQKTGDGKRIDAYTTADQDFGKLDDGPLADMPGEGGDPSLASMLG